MLGTQIFSLLLLTPKYNFGRILFIHVFAILFFISEKLGETLPTHLQSWKKCPFVSCILLSLVRC